MIQKYLKKPSILSKGLFKYLQIDHTALLLAVFPTFPDVSRASRASRSLTRAKEDETSGDDPDLLGRLLEPTVVAKRKNGLNVQ